MNFFSEKNEYPSLWCLFCFKGLKRSSGGNKKNNIIALNSQIKFKLKKIKQINLFEHFMYSSICSRIKMWKHIYIRQLDSICHIF